MDVEVLPERPIHLRKQRDRRQDAGKEASEKPRDRHRPRLYLPASPDGVRHFTTNSFGNVSYELARRASAFDAVATYAVNDVIVGEKENRADAKKHAGHWTPSDAFWFSEQVLRNRQDVRARVICGPRGSREADASSRSHEANETADYRSNLRRWLCESRVMTKFRRTS